MAARKTTTRTLRILRTVLLVSLILLLALVWALYRFGRAGLPQNETESAPEEDGLSADTVVMAGEGFDYLITQGEVTLARIRAHRVLSETEDEVTLERLDPVEIYREDGDLYSVTSDTGTYNFHTQATTLVGNVVLDGPREMQLRTEGLAMGHERNTVTSDTAVSFSMAGEFVGTANSLTAYLDDDLFKLSNGVRLASTSPDRQPIELKCNRLTFDRRAGLIRAEGRVEFTQGASYVRSKRMVFHLTEDESRIRYISGRWGLTARLAQGFGQRLARKSEIDADEFSVLLDPDTGKPIEAEMTARPAKVVRLTMVDETRLARLITSPIIHLRFSDGEVRHAEAFQRVQIREFLDFSRRRSIRWACGERAVVDFDASGEMRHAVFSERVEFRQGRSLAKGDRVEMNGEPYTIEMVGTPARLISTQGELAAPAITQEGEEGDIRATGGVRGQFDSAGGASTISLGGAKGPIRVESAEARWNQQTPSFKFEQDVRLWQGENLLLAQEVETLTKQDLVVARGGVRTILQPQRAEEEGESAEDAETEPPIEQGTDEATPDAVDDSPIEITSGWMEYGLESRLLAYHDNVQMRQSGRRMTCDDAEATLRESGGMETLHCVGEAKVEDDVAGRTVSGDEALFRVAADEITFQGNPVVMTGEEGERIEGATLVYDLGSGAARVERATGPPPDPPAEDDNGPETTDAGEEG